MFYVYLLASRPFERQLKKWKRAWKIQLIEQDNPQWIDLYPMITA